MIAVIQDKPKPRCEITLDKVKHVLSGYNFSFMALDLLFLYRMFMFGMMIVFITTHTIFTITPHSTSVGLLVCVFVPPRLFTLRSHRPSGFRNRPIFVYILTQSHTSLSGYFRMKSIPFTLFSAIVLITFSPPFTLLF